MARTPRRSTAGAGATGEGTARPRVAAYLGSKRRIPFNQDGIFRHYAALDR
jgi:glutathione S-transferase